jgi:hypothetical protein
MSKLGEINNDTVQSPERGLLFSRQLIDGTRRIGNIAIDPVDNRLCIDTQFSRNCSKALPLQSHQNSFLSHSDWITIQVGGRCIFLPAVVALESLASGQIPPHPDLFFGYLAVRTDRHITIPYQEMDY